MAKEKVIKADCCGHESVKGQGSGGDHDRERPAWMKYLPAIVSFAMLAAGLIVDNFSDWAFFTGWIRLAWYALAYLPVGVPVLKDAWKTISHGDLFNEFTLMGLATIGAFAIGEYPEGVAVMLFYSVGEYFQHAAVDRSKRNIKALLDVRPDTANVVRGGKTVAVAPETVAIGEIIEVRAGEKVPLDGTMLSGEGSFNTSALTGESRPKTIREGETVLAGMVDLNAVVRIKVDKAYNDSSLARILEMVQDASSRKAKTELLIRRFARIYTPIVFLLALGIAFVPALFADSYVFSEWIYRALVFLVISCPCALVVSVPLGYFGGIGAASRNGILFKGANYLDLMTKVNTVVMDKTGTLTKGVFNVRDIVPAEGGDSSFTALAAALESNSNHPVAKAVTEYARQNGIDIPETKNVEEIAGHGVSGTAGGKAVLAGNAKLLDKYGIAYPAEVRSIPETTVLVAADGKYAGYITIADEVKEDAAKTVADLHGMGIKTVMLSGDKDPVVQSVASGLGIDEAHGELLPEGKAGYMEKLKENPENVTAFVGDGINDAPVLALSDVGIAMGAMGSDAAIEVADVVIQTDQPSKLVTAIKISKATRRIVIQNITGALGVKIVVMVLGAMGIASMWIAVFADVGVALLAILNSIRILRYKER